MLAEPVAGKEAVLASERAVASVVVLAAASDEEQDAVLAWASGAAWAGTETTAEG